jgi:hypothetical protein
MDEAAYQSVFSTYLFLKCYLARVFRMSDPLQCRKCLCEMWIKAGG